MFGTEEGKIYIMMNDTVCLIIFIWLLFCLIIFYIDTILTTETTRCTISD